MPDSLNSEHIKKATAEFINALANLYGRQDGETCYTPEFKSITISRLDSRYPVVRINLVETIHLGKGE